MYCTDIMQGDNGSNLGKIRVSWRDVVIFVKTGWSDPKSFWCSLILFASNGNGFIYTRELEMSLKISDVRKF